MNKYSQDLESGFICDVDLAWYSKIWFLLWHLKLEKENNFEFGLFGMSDSVPLNCKG